MPEVRQIAGRHVEAKYDPKDIDSILTPERSKIIGENQEFARSALVKLEETRSITTFEMIRSLLSVIIGAVHQVADGKIERICYGVGQNILQFQEEVRLKISQYGSLTCYPDVIEARRQLDTIRKIFPLLDELLIKIVDYGSR